MPSRSLRALVAPLALIPLIGHATADETALRPLIDRIIAGGAPGLIVLSRNNADEVLLASGDGNLAPRTSMAATDRMRMGSLVKSFVATAMLQLAEEGKVDLDGAIETHLPAAVPNGRAITIRQLLNHTSGIFDYWQDESFFDRLLGDPSLVWPPATLVELAVAHPPLNEPGAAWAYSNTNYILLGEVIESVFGRSLGEELTRRIFEPLELDATSFDSLPSISGAYAHGYADLGESVPADLTMVDPSAAWAAGGGLVSTAEDVADFYSALLGGELLSPSSLAEMMTTVPARGGLDYGLGLAEVAVPCGTGWGHRGEFPGYLSFALTSEDGVRQAVVLVNYYSLTKVGHAAFDELVAAAYCR
jgi:D-alanyl-D-alanine carboxypeptidase